MADAEIIPLGTRGRPGRGSGRDKPSTSSRALAAPGTRRDEPTQEPVEDPTAHRAEEPLEELVVTADATDLAGEAVDVPLDAAAVDDADDPDDPDGPDGPDEPADPADR